MDNDLNDWLAAFTPGLSFDAKPSPRGLRALLEEALLSALPHGEGISAHVASEVRTGPGYVAFGLRGLTPEGRAAVEAMSGDGG